MKKLKKKKEKNKIENKKIEIISSLCQNVDKTYPKKIEDTGYVNIDYDGEVDYGY